MPVFRIALQFERSWKVGDSLLLFLSYVRSTKE